MSAAVHKACVIHKCCDININVRVTVRPQRRGSVRVRTPSRGEGLHPGAIFGRGLSLGELSPLYRGDRHADEHCTMP